MPTIDLNSLGDVELEDLLIFTKAQWSDPFAHLPGALIEEVVWSHAPDVSVASFQWRYGSDVIRPGETTGSTVAAITTRGYYVLILQPLGSGNYLPWLGYADLPVTIEEDDVSGVQRVPCYGFDRALQFAIITTTIQVDPDDPDLWFRKEMGSVFNRDLKGNRTAAMVKLAPADDDPTVYAFENPGVEARNWWSTRQIVQHIATFHLPTFDQVPGDIPWAIVGLDRLPNWDQPKLESDTRSIFDCLTELANDSRMLGWRVSVEITYGMSTPIETPPTIDAINIEFFTRAAASVTLPSIGTLPANHDLQTWIHDEDPLTESTIDENDAEMFDQVIVRGPREVAVGTFRYDQEWEPGWLPAELTAYVNTYSAEGVWATATLTEKRELNQYFRSKPEYDDVYRNYPIRDDWDGTCNGENLFWKEAPEDDNYIPYLGNVQIADRLPLFRGVDYIGDVTEVDESRGRKTLPILAWIEEPGRTVYKPIQTFLTDIGAPRHKHPNSLAFELQIKPYFDRGPGFELITVGAPQHAHQPAFTGNDGDPENANTKMWGEIDSETILITAAMIGDRRPEVRLPSTVSADFVRRKYITLDHPGLQHVHIAAGTVVDIDSEGIEEVSEGGTLRDPFDMLTALATLAGERYLETQKTARIRTGRPINAEPGSLIVSINGATVGAVIKEVRVSTPVVENDSPPPYTMTILAVDNEFDLAGLVSRVPLPEEPKR